MEERGRKATKEINFISSQELVKEVLQQISRANKQPPALLQPLVLYINHFTWEFQ